MRKNYKVQPLVADINITPFTDVILVLLIIFIIATPLISQNSIEVKLPEAASLETVDSSKPVYITITGEGIVYLEDKVLTTQELRRRIKGVLAKDRNSKVVVAADRACRFQDVVKVIDTLQETGVKSLNIATKTNK